MDPTLRDLLDELFRSGREHDAGEAEHARRFLNLEPETARLVSLLIALGRRRQILEIGTSNGYSTIWLADALPYWTVHAPLGGTRARRPASIT